jgi:hypothetical protein
MPGLPWILSRINVYSNKIFSLQVPDIAKKGPYSCTTRAFFLKIAFISHEYPPETGGGGIGTYVKQAARMLAERGHMVEVFAGSLSRSGSSPDGPVNVHRIQVGSRDDFPQKVAGVFCQRHKEELLNKKGKFYEYWEEQKFD